MLLKFEETSTLASISILLSSTGGTSLLGNPVSGCFPREGMSRLTRLVSRPVFNREYSDEML